MTRDEAIAHIWYLSGGVSGEFCANEGQRKDLERETTDALLALGVTEEEMKDD